MGKRPLALTFAFLLAVLPARAEPPLPSAIAYAYPDQSVWTTRLDAQGQPANPLLRVAEELFRRAKLPWSAHAYPAARLFESLRNGNANFSMLVKGPALEQCCLTSRKPIASTELRIYHAAGKPPIHGRDDLRGKSVIVIRGYSYGSLLAHLADPKNGVVTTTAATHQIAFSMLRHGRAEYLLDYAGPAREVLAATPGLVLEHETVDRLNVHLLLWKGYPDAEAAMARLEAIADGLDVDELMDR